MPDKTPTRAAQREAARSAILSAARLQFSRFGYEGTSIKMVSETSGVSKQRLLYYFISKQNLWKETVSDLFEDVNAEFERIDNERGGAKTLKDLVRGYNHVAGLFPAYVLIPMIEGLSDSWRSEWLATTFLAPHIISFEATVKNLVESEEVVDVPPLHLQGLVTGGAQLFLALAPLWRIAGASKTNSQSFLDAYTNTMIELLTKS